MEIASLVASHGQERGDQGDLLPHLEGEAVAREGQARRGAHHVDHMRYVEGYEPSEAKQRTDPHVGREM